MPFETCSAHAPWPEHTSPLSRPTGQAIVHVMMRAYLSRRRPLVIVACRWLLSVRLGLGGSPPARGGGRALPERGPALLMESVAASRRCLRSMRRCSAVRGAPAADTFASDPARKPGASVPRPIARRASGALSPMRDASRRAAAPNCSNLLQSKDFAIRRCPKRARGTSVDAAGGSTSPLPQTFDSCGAAGPAKAQTGCPPCAEAPTPSARWQRCSQ